MIALPHLWLDGFLLHLWQASLFGGVICLVIAFVPGIPARLKFLAGWVALLRFLVPAGLAISLLGSIPLSLGHAHSPFGAFWMPPFIVESGKLGQDAVAAHLHSLPTLLIAFWLSGVLLFLGLGAIRLSRGLALLRSQASPLGERERLRLETLSQRVGLRPGSVTGCSVSCEGWLGVVGLFRSRVIIPEGLLSGLDEHEADSLLLHELMHVKRRDNLLRLLQAAAVALFWFHPLVWWLDRRLRWESERACDEGVLGFMGSGNAYASGLFKAARFSLGLDLPGVSGMSRFRLQTRIQAVLNHKKIKDSSMKSLLVAFALIGTFALATLAAPAPDENSQEQTASKSKICDASQLSKGPVPLKQVKFVYPAELQKAGITARVDVDIVIDEKGDVISAKVMKTTDERFNQSALEAIKHWTFEPGQVDGKAVKTRMVVPVQYALTPQS